MNLPTWNLTGSDLREYWNWFQNPSPPYGWSSLSGYLLVRATASGEEAEPGTLSLQLISPAQGYKVWFLRILTWVAGLWFLITFVVGLIIVWRWALFRKLFGKLDFDIKGGWASTLTTTGAVLGTFLSAGILSEDTFFMAKGQYIALNVIFGLVIVLSYVLFRLLQYGLTLLVAGALILGAAAGELATVCFLLYELAFQGVLSTSDVPLLGISIGSLMQIVLACTAVVVTLLAGWKALETIKKGKAAGEDDKALVRRFYKAWEDNDDLPELDKILALYYVYHDPEERQGVGAIKQKVRASHNEFRSIHFVFEDQAAEGGKVASRITMHAERPPAAGGGDNAGRKVSLEFIDICRIAGGEIEEQWIRPTPES